MVTWTVPVATDNVGTTGSISGTKNPLDTFNVGDTTVTYSISDTSGNVGSCSFLVRIVDAENPAVTCPPDIVQVPMQNCQEKGLLETHTLPFENLGCSLMLLSR